MKILFDYQIFGHQRVGGISRYFSALMDGLRQIKGVETALSLAYHKNQYLGDLRLTGPGWWRRFNRVVRSQSKAYCNRQLSLRDLKMGEYDIFHPTNYDPYFLDALGDKPFVLTVHDMVHEIFKGRFSLDDHEQVIRNKHLLIERANAIIAVSHCTAQDLLHFYPYVSDKVKVIPHGAPRVGSQGTMHPSLLLPASFLLWIGNRRYYKNFLGFYESRKSRLTGASESSRRVCWSTWI